MISGLEGEAVAASQRRAARSGGRQPAGAGAGSHAGKSRRASGALEGGGGSAVGWGHGGGGSAASGRARGGGGAACLRRRVYNIGLPVSSGPETGEASSSSYSSRSKP
ncbi:hypothetical protein GUJ93_ZPchr0010g7752 [Zizania palustris]|uniref:Uncharacterized protein n=1 Tax=Zizania palustris TaxID=103762 RepID=A0A8J5W868_ZIZPA|nr:hypothetical protein GUJ93_ZPchr0010g7752 [Zizania palustris]